jgi:hypothetical protein
MGSFNAACTRRSLMFRARKLKRLYLRYGQLLAEYEEVKALIASLSISNYQDLAYEAIKLQGEIGKIKAELVYMDEPI